MRKLIYGINLTLDGCCDHTKGIAGEDIHEYFTRQMHEADVLLYGRKTYELMVPFWPDMARDNSGPTQSLNDFAKAFDAVSRIVVVSRTLQQPVDGKTTIIRSNLAEEIQKLKNEPGKNILLGGVDVPSQLIALGLVDEFRFVIQPVIAGEGRRLLDSTPLPEKLQLKLVETKILSSGSVVVRYVK